MGRRFVYEERMEGKAAVEKKLPRGVCKEGVSQEQKVGSLWEGSDVVMHLPWGGSKNQGTLSLAQAEVWKKNVSLFLSSSPSLPPPFSLSLNEELSEEWEWEPRKMPRSHSVGETCSNGHSDCLVSKAIWGQWARLAARALQASCFQKHVFWSGEVGRREIFF